MPGACGRAGRVICTGRPRRVPGLPSRRRRGAAPDDAERHRRIHRTGPICVARAPRVASRGPARLGRCTPARRSARAPQLSAPSARAGAVMRVAELPGGSHARRSRARMPGDPARPGAGPHARPRHRLRQSRRAPSRPPGPSPPGRERLGVLLDVAFVWKRQPCRLLARPPGADLPAAGAWLPGPLALASGRGPPAPPAPSASAHRRSGRRPSRCAFRVSIGSRSGEPKCPGQRGRPPARRLRRRAARRSGEAVSVGFPPERERMRSAAAGAGRAAGRHRPGCGTRLTAG